MGRTKVLFGFALLGYVLGFLSYLSRSVFAAIILAIMPNISAEVVGAAVSGFAGAFIAVLGVMLWSYLSPPS
jgi:hypothetical protein